MFGISRREIETRIKNRLLDELASQGEVSISGVGKLSVRSDGTVYFLASETFIHELARRVSTAPQDRTSNE